MGNMFKKLKLGDKIVFGNKYCDETGREDLRGKTIMLTPQGFEEDDGLSSYEVIEPGINVENDDDPDSTLHLFGNDLEDYYDCEIILATQEDIDAINDNIRNENKAIANDIGRMVDVINTSDSLEATLHLFGNDLEDYSPVHQNDRKETIIKKHGLPGFPYGKNLIEVNDFELKLIKGMKLDLYYNPDGVESENADGHSEYFVLEEDMTFQEISIALIGKRDTTITYSEAEDDWAFKFDINVIFDHPVVDDRADEDYEFQSIKKGYVR